MGMTGPVRALCYRLAVATGLRYSEIGSIQPESFDWKAPSVTVAAAYTKNGDPATLPLPNDLADDLAAYVATLPPGTPVFPLPDEKGAEMLRVDLEAAGIPYRDAAGLVFDFHALRCQTATLADAAGSRPGSFRRLMRHSTLELTGRYTRPRAVDIEAAAGMLRQLSSPSATETPRSHARDDWNRRDATAPHKRRFCPSLCPRRRRIGCGLCGYWRDGGIRSRTVDEADRRLKTRLLARRRGLADTVELPGRRLERLTCGL